MFKGVFVCLFFLPMLGLAAGNVTFSGNSTLNGPVINAEHVSMLIKANLYNRFAGIAQQKEITNLIDDKKYKEAIELLETIYAEHKHMLIEANTTVNTLLSSLVALREIKGGYFSRPLAASMSREEVKRVEKELVYDLSVALSKLARVKALNTNAIIDVALVDALSQQGAKKGQYKKFQIALAEAPDPIPVYYYYAQVLRDHNNEKKANEMLSKAIAQVTKRDVISKKAYIELDRGNVDHQLKTKFEFIYAYIRSQHVPSYVSSGRAGLRLQVKQQLQRGQVEDAIRSLEQLPETNGAVFLQARVDILNGDMEAAKGKLDRLYKSANKDVSVLARLSSLYLAAGQYNQVKSLYDQTKSKEGWFLLMAVNKSLADLLSGEDVSKSSAWIEDILKYKQVGLQPNIRMQFNAAKGRYYNLIGEYKKANDSYQAALGVYQLEIQDSADEDKLLFAEIYLGLANVQYSTGKAKEAATSFEQVLALKDLDDDLFVMKEADLGLFFLNPNHFLGYKLYEKAEKILKKKPDSYTVVNLLTSDVIRLKSGDTASEQKEWKLNGPQAKDFVCKSLKSPMLKKRIEDKLSRQQKLNSGCEV